MKKITISEEHITEFLGKIEASLRGKKVVPEKITHEVNPSIKLSSDEQVNISFENKAWKKMQELVLQADKEIGWHGTVERVGEREFIIKDIFVFPQTVTGATVTTDDEEYARFVMQLTDEEINNMRFYGHSHVNMQTRPSGTDDVYQENLMQNIQDYYIFGIFNKRKEMWWNVYDVVNNILYEEKDIACQYFMDEYEEWADSQIEQYVKSAPTTNYAQGAYGNNYWKNKENKQYGDYYNGVYCD